MDLGDHGKESTEVSNEKIPDVTGWNKYKLHKYLSKRLPKEVLDSLLTHVRYDEFKKYYFNVDIISSIFRFLLYHQNSSFQIVSYVLLNIIYT